MKRGSCVITSCSIWEINFFAVLSGCTGGRGEESGRKAQSRGLRCQRGREGGQRGGGGKAKMRIDYNQISNRGFFSSSTRTAERCCSRCCIHRHRSLTRAPTPTRHHPLRKHYRDYARKHGIVFLAERCSLGGGSDVPGATPVIDPKPWAKRRSRKRLKRGEAKLGGKVWRVEGEVVSLKSSRRGRGLRVESRGSRAEGRGPSVEGGKDQRRGQGEDRQTCLLRAQTVLLAASHRGTTESRETWRSEAGRPRAGRHICVGRACV